VAKGPSIALVVGLVAGACSSCGSPPREAGPPAGVDAALPPERAIQTRLVEATGGRDAWRDARFIAFDWIEYVDGEPIVSRRHAWDRETGRASLQMTIERRPVVVVYNVDTGSGRAWIDDTEVEIDADRAALVRQAQALHGHDTYWLLMPFMWDEPGVTATYAGVTRDADGKRWETVELNLDHGSEGRRWRSQVLLDPDTGLVGRWAHNETPGAADGGVRTDWTGWERRGPLLVALDRPLPDGTPHVSFGDVRISSEIDEVALSLPAHTAR